MLLQYLIKDEVRVNCCLFSKVAYMLTGIYIAYGNSTARRNKEKIKSRSRRRELVFDAQHNQRISDNSKTRGYQDDIDK